MNAFKLIPLRMGSGWLSLHVAVDWRHSWVEKNPDTQGEVILTLDAQNANEVCSEIDKLIQELEGLKEQAKRKFDGWKG